jgi:hypothetical protein
MGDIINTVITVLKKGSIPKIILYSDTEVFPAPPYVVVKPETGPLPNTRGIRIIAHHRKGQYDILEKYILSEIADLLLCGLTGAEGEKYRLYSAGYTDITPEPSDNSYFMERILYMPFLIN